MERSADARRSLSYGLLAAAAAITWIARMAWSGLFGFGAIDLVLLAIAFAASVAGLRAGGRALFGGGDARPAARSLVGIALCLLGVGIFVTLVILAIRSFNPVGF